MSPPDRFRHLPSVDALASDPGLAGAVREHGRAVVVARARQALQEARDALRADGSADAAVLASSLPERIASGLERESAGSLVEVLNATGVVVHTNLGRAPLGAATLQRLAQGAVGGVNLELDLATGKRGRRAEGCERLLCELTGAEAACVVNNCAASLLLALNTFAAGKAVLVSRGELVEIGGSFRIPAVCERSGARLHEVGTTNRTRPSDYEEALKAGGVGLILKVHPSNFRLVGFTEEACLSDLVELGRRHGVPVLMDQGSGALEDLSRLGVVTFSGDKLLGGPQAGCMVGRRDAIAACRTNPLFRALRVGRLTALALEATLWAHRTGRLQDVPVQRQLRLPAEEVRARAEALRARIAADAEAAGVVAAVEAGDSTSGGGSSPSSRIPTWLLSLRGGGREAGMLAEGLRRGSPAVLARVAEGALLIDLRTVEPDRDPAVAAALQAILRG
jgi:L-seryl-tRNA(Ser) seleniumtransferase